MKRQRKMAKKFTDVTFPTLKLRLLLLQKPFTRRANRY